MSRRRRAPRSTATFAVALSLALIADAARPAPTGREENAAAARDELPPRRAVGGLAGLRTTSRVVFEGLPERPHLLEAVFVFPERARWSIEDEGGAPGSRRMRFRSGARVFDLAPGSAESLEMHAAERDLAVLQLELRRAALLWPAGLEWEAADGARRANLDGLGSLEAVGLDDSGRPAALLSRTPDGEEFERLDDLRWSEREGRTLPVGWSLSHRGRRVWREELLSVDLRARYVDAFFLPPDRRTKPRGTDERTHLIDLPRRTQRRVPLPEGTTVALARRREAEARATLREELAGRGLALDPFGVLELDAAGRPRAARIALAVPAPPPGEGWSVEPAGVGLSRLLEPGAEGEPADVPAALAALLRETPPDARPGEPLLLFAAERPEEGRLRLFVPLLPADDDR